MNAEEKQRENWNTEVARRLEQGRDLVFSRAQFAKAVEASADDEALEAFLDDLVNSGVATPIKAYKCPVEGCSRPIFTHSADPTVCPSCNTDYQQEGLVALEDHTFIRLEGEISRDIMWMIVIHGMNSRATWQEEFSWQIANRLSYSAPVLIYKYGWATIDVLAKWLHKRLAKRLGERISIAVTQATKLGRPARPDIIAHSFGTHLLSLVLEDPEFEELKFGRIITAGSIVRPDFDWDRLIDSGRVEAVLNHTGARDRPVRIAQYVIPGTGPSGRLGYISRAALNVSEMNFGHSDFFKPDTLRSLIADDGLWHSFLTHPLTRFRPDGHYELKQWRPAIFLLRGPVRMIGCAVFIIVAPFSWLRRRIDP